MPAEWLLPLLQTVTGAANSGMSYAQSKRNTRDTLVANMQLADYQFGKNVEMWNMQNEYNSPVSQRSRMEEAGYNPALMYGGNLQNTSSASPKYSEIRHESKVTPFQLPDTIGKFVDLEMKQAQVDLVKRNADLTAAKEQSELIGQQVARAKADMMAIDLSYKPQMSEYLLEGKKKSLELMDKKIAAAVEDILLKKGDQKLKAQVLKNKEADNYNIWLRNQYQAALNELVEQGIMPTDNLIVRQIAKQLGNVKEFIQKIPGEYSKWKDKNKKKGRKLKMLPMK